MRLQKCLNQNLQNLQNESFAVHSEMCTETKEMKIYRKEMSVFTKEMNFDGKDRKISCKKK